MRNLSVEKMFTMLDLDKDGCFTPGELADFLEARGMQVAPKDNAGVQVLVDRYDGDRDGRVNIQDFAREVRPKSPRRVNH